MGMLILEENAACNESVESAMQMKYTIYKIFELFSIIWLTSMHRK